SFAAAACTIPRLDIVADHVYVLKRSEHVTHEFYVLDKFSKSAVADHVAVACHEVEHLAVGLPADGSNCVDAKFDVLDHIFERGFSRGDASVSHAHQRREPVVKRPSATRNFFSH